MDGKWIIKNAKMGNRGRYNEGYVGKLILQVLTTNWKYRRHMTSINK